MRPAGRFCPPCAFGFTNAGGSDDEDAPERGERAGESAPDAPGAEAELFQKGAGENSR